MADLGSIREKVNEIDIKAVAIRNLLDKVLSGVVDRDSSSPLTSEQKTAIEAEMKSTFQALQVLIADIKKEWKL